MTEGTGPLRARGRTPAVALILTGVVLLAAALWWIGHNRTHPAGFQTASVPSGSTQAGSENSKNAAVATSSDGATAAVRRPDGAVTEQSAATAPSEGTSSSRQSPTEVARTNTSTPASTMSTSPSSVPAAPIPEPRTIPRPVGSPTRVDIPALDVDAPVEPVLNAGGVLRPPDDPQRLGWWIGSSPPGTDEGSTVIAGHVDSATAGAGALYRLSELAAGTEIEVRADGGTVTYRVTGLDFYSKADGLPADLFAFGGPPRLVLITCGGAFDEATGSYEENVVVTAAPI